MMCVIAATLSFAVPHHSLAPASVRHRSPAPRLSDPPSAPLGHVFVLHADLRSLLTDATLYPTTDPVDSGWFPNAQRQNDPPPLPPFTSRQRVHQLPGTPAGAPLVFLANVDGRLEPQRDCEPFTGRPPLDWFVDAARQFLQLAAASVGEEGTRARCRRAQPLLALPVVGTGNGGARTASGRMISRLLEVLYDFTAVHDIDVALVVKGERRFSAAQALRRQMAPAWEDTLGARLCGAALELAQRATADELALFIGAGVSVGAGLPAWQELLTSLAERDDVPLGPGEAVVTTNYDELFEAAWRGAASDFKVLPYEADARSRFVLKLHGDLRRPQDIVLTRAQLSGAREQRAALSGVVQGPLMTKHLCSASAPLDTPQVVQGLLMTKHLCFVGFSLQDPNFSEVAETVRATLTGDSSTASRNLFGSLLSLHNRPLPGLRQPFLAELWPDVQQVPMDMADASGPDRLSSAQCARRLDIFLDKVSLDASTPTRHLLDPNFSGVFDKQQRELREALLLFEAELASRPDARAAAGFEAVSALLRGLGLPADSPALAEPDVLQPDEEGGNG
ncbi:hypothetical protein EMIHUDRAFT_468099 [Emiliania huxleyi CCMP1516]|uniref:SIR2-like domain-containing protein n=2 Tax=Emiliania huxleyi TaxID=2903 RepID=A0A0D3K7M7_EMIH1|nr:hypothetical protein EMIHUDRAFT_468099 [Emiliania huxleyi CCMP1516]EOD31762.1 hypothetical protein EMIHUDRAFT_468099 [Emiliania huxleyi CCMP1516]|eukprot:XP_005784191.1 hypothetical protein EMIHUDRAFT_468099 [Emiliania huxleyi CCMP1516]